MAQRMYHESGQDGRSVLGMLAVQVEKDPRTGATIVRSVTPVSGPADGAHSASTIFDDGRKSIHAVGGSAAQPSSHELGQILSAIDGVGMKVLLDEVALTPVQEGAREEARAPRGKVQSVNQESQIRSSSGSAAMGISTAGFGKKTVAAEGSPKAEAEEGEMLCEGPVTLMFMGYADGRGEGEEPGGMLTAERVMITEDGEELLLERGADGEPQGPAEESRDKGFQDVPLEGKSGKEEEKEEGEGRPGATAEGQGKPKRKSCQCCTLM